jgi:hypothetical protein
MPSLTPRSSQNQGRNSTTWFMMSSLVVLNP